jgi:hypothetical protein
MTVEEATVQPGTLPRIWEEPLKNAKIDYAATLVPVVKAAKDGNGDELVRRGWRSLRSIGGWRVTIKPLVGSLGVIVVLNEFLDEPVKMSVIEGNDVVQQLSTWGPKRALHEWILPRASVSFANAPTPQAFKKSETASPKSRSLSRNMNRGCSPYGIASRSC